MHVLIDARLLHRPKSGLERVQINIIRELAARDEIERLRIVVMRGTVLPDVLPSNVETLEVCSTADIMRVLVSEKVDERPDVYHMTYFPDRDPWDLMLPLAAPASVLEVHDAILNRHPEYHPNLECWSWYHSFTSQLVQSSTRMLLHSRSVAREVAEDLGGDPNNADVAPLAVDPDLLEPLTQSQVDKRLRNLGISEPYFLSIGKDYPHKGHETMFRAVAELPEPVQVICAGSKVWNQGRTTDHLLKKLKIQDQVTWVEGLDDQDIKALLQGSHALVFPSHEEGFGLPPIEAMSLGVPVLATRARSIPEVCGDGAWLFEPGDSQALYGLMKKILADGQEVQDLIARGHRQAETFSWARTADATIECYKEAIRSAKRSGRRRSKAAQEVKSVLEIVAGSPFDPVSELAAWKERCLGAEDQLARVDADRQTIIARLHELERASDIPETPVAPVAELHRPRWSLRRRLRKLKLGLRKCMS